MTLCWNLKSSFYSEKILFAQQLALEWTREIDDIDEVEKSAKNVIFKKQNSKVQQYWNPSSATLLKLKSMLWKKNI